MPKVSVIVAVYGAEKYIEKCARSLFEQTLDDMEFIFVDDCSPDRTVDILNVLIEEYRPRFEEMNYKVRVERMPTNSGLPTVRKHGVQLATGDYVIHCDNDDWVDRDMYQQMYETAIAEKADAVVCDWFIERGNEQKRVTAVRSLSKQSMIGGIMSDTVTRSVWNKMFARTLYDKGIEKPLGNMGEDLVLCIQLFFFSSKISYIEKPLYHHFYNPTSISNTRSKEKALEYFVSSTDNVDLVVNFLEKHGVVNEYEKDLSVFKYTEKKFLIPYLEDRNVYFIWRNKYREINNRIWFMDFVTWRQKAKFTIYFVKHVILNK